MIYAKGVEILEGIIASDEKGRIIKEIQKSKTLEEIFNLLFFELKKIEPIDCKMAFFPQGEILKIKYIGLPEKVEDLRETFESQNIQLEVYPDLRKCLEEKRQYLVTEQTLEDENKYLKSTLKFFRAQYAALLPIQMDGEKTLGLVMLLKYSSEITSRAMNALQELLDLSYNHINLFLSQDVVQDEEITARERYEKLVTLKKEVESWERDELLIKKLFNELFPILHFELGWMQTAKDQKLPIVAGAGSNPETEKIYTKLLSFFGSMENAPYYTTPPGPEMACCFPFINNSFAYIPDVFVFYKNLKNIKLPEKDEKALIMVGKPFRSVLHLPVRKEGKSKGLVQLVSFTRKATVNEKDIALLIEIFQQIPLELY